MDNITEINKKVDRLDSVIFGENGPGLKDTVVKLDFRIEKFDITLRDLTVAVNGLVRFMDETRSMDKIKVKMTSTIRWLVGTIITICVALVSVVITIFMK